MAAVVVVVVVVDDGELVSWRCAVVYIVDDGEEEEEEEADDCFGTALDRMVSSVGNLSRLIILGMTRFDNFGLDLEEWRSGQWNGI